MGKYKEMLEVLSKNKIFKFKTLLADRNSELNMLYKNYKERDILNFLAKLNREGFLISEESFKRKKVRRNNYTSVCIDWRKIFKRNILDPNDDMFKFFLKYPITFSITEGKAKYSMLLEYYKFEQPSNLINSLDSLFIMYFVNKEKFKLITDSDSQDLLLDLYSNLYSYTRTTPINSNNLYEIDSYEQMLKESGIVIDTLLLKKLYEVKERTELKIQEHYKQMI